jgi:hypothetical protein
VAIIVMQKKNLTNRQFWAVEALITNLVLKSIGYALPENSGNIPMYGYG